MSVSPALDSSVATLRGVGPWVAQRLQRLGVDCIGDLLYLLPIRYEDRTEIQPLGGLRPGSKVLVEGELELAEVVFRRRRSLLCRIADGTGSLTLRFFYFNNSQQKQLTRGVRIRCFGDVRAGPTGPEMVHPEYKVLSLDSDPPDNVLTPVYPTTEGIHQQRLRQLTDQALVILENNPMTDYIGDYLTNDWPALNDSLRFLHRPPQGSELSALINKTHPCQQRIALEELIAHRLSLRKMSLTRTKEKAFPLKDTQQLIPKLRSELPYQLTGGQELVISEIVTDLAKKVPMHRLLQGDVGSGKTIVAAIAALVAGSSGFQAGFMAPTELLAEQHFDNLTRWLDPLGIKVVTLVGGILGSEREETLKYISSGEARIVVGTHALFQRAVQFKNLALMIVDEQHRFGVAQRLEFKKKGQLGRLSPHQLVMTATPIPRTLAMTVYSDLDCSVIDELPPGRKPVKTVAMPESRRPELVQRVLSHCLSGQQAYWVCPLIEESEVINSQAATDLARELEIALPKLAVGLIHGRMKPHQKESTMQQFKNGELNLLVATTVIEVGVDVPNASLMIIENSERMGLSQLHQLRGRVGRGSQVSSCVLLFKLPISRLARERLSVMRKTSDGFLVAQKDLELRGPGDMLGTRQTGIIQLRVADLMRDMDLLPQVIEFSEKLLCDFPQNVEPLIKRWNNTSSEYAKV
ncbi:MAG: ATP-dependent DNA helicase RecG [Candidatus Rariloculaceae bacterium]